MKVLVLLGLAALACLASSQCNCKTMKWATCDGTPCSCFLLTGTDNFKQSLNCQKLIPKCFLMQAEMNRARKGEDTRTIGGKPVESAFVDNDGIYDPVCERDGKFKAKQCNNTEECWCVNSAGVRRTDKGDKNTINCTELEKFAPKVGSQTLNMTNIKIYYVDEKPPTFTMKNLSGGIIAVIVVVVLAVVIGLLALVRTHQH
uniref:Epithelial cell adhesion molecule n=1 Tax=Kryptolebias marmoratus TaxID=37003 RepID=A0A3Q3AG32_KRYMA